jgi:threonine dehydratase
MNPGAAEPSSEAFAHAQELIRPFLHRPPLFGSAALSEMTGTELHLKAENLQKTGSFKPRGALVALIQLSAKDRARGVITMSAGNHGQGLAFAAAKFDCRCTVIVPDNATTSKVEAMRAYGAEVVFAGGLQLGERLHEEQRQRGQVFVHPFANSDVVTGQGTVGLEILEDLPEVAAVVVPVGGGGLISGVAAAIKQRRAHVRVIGVEPEGAAAVSLSLQRGTPQHLEKVDTIADGLAPPFAEEYNLEIIRQYVDDLVLVSDEELAHALVMILERTKLLVEPAGAAAVAALLSGRVALPPGIKTVAVLTGGNIDRSRLMQVFQRL